MKSTVKSCSCFMCRFAKSNSRRVKHEMKSEERAARHGNKIALSQGNEVLTAAHRGGRYG